MTVEEWDTLAADRHVSVVVGIDPDVDRNGLAILTRATHTLELHTLPFFELTERLSELKWSCHDKGQTMKVFVEAGWLNKTNWHLPRIGSLNKAAAMGVSVGRNQQVGHLTIEACRYLDIDVEEVKPLRKCWKGKDGKITSEELEKITGQKFGRINQEARDAALIAWVKAELPIRM